MSPSDALAYAGRLLSQRDLLESQLRERLAKRGAEGETVSDVISRLEKMGWIDDRRWIEGYIRGQLRRLKGPMAIRLKLIQKGAPRHLIEEQIGFLSEEVQREQIDALLEKRYRGKERHKVYQALVRRGFAPSLVRERLQ